MTWELLEALFVRIAEPAARMPVPKLVKNGFKSGSA
jgi:hypothetical protein